MKTFLGCAAVLGLAVSISSNVGCSNATSPVEDGNGRVGLDVQLAPGVTISSVAWAISNAATSFTSSGTVNVGSSNAVAFQVGGLPSGSGYTIALTAKTVDGSLSCAGEANFAINSGASTDVAVTLYCNGATADAGAAAVTATTQVCANINSLSASPMETSVGSSVALSATASAGAVVPSFAWTATAGSLSDPTSAAPTFTCPDTPESVTITLTVSPSAAGCSTTTAESLTVTCDLLTPTFTNVYSTIIGPACTSCHQSGKGGVTMGMLDLSTQAAAYSNLVGVPAEGIVAGMSGVQCATLGIDVVSDGGVDGGPVLLRVAPGDAPDSLMYEKVNSRLVGTNPPCGSGMPLKGAPLTQPQVDLIQAWITAGAQND